MNVAVRGDVVEASENQQIAPVHSAVVFAASGVFAFLRRFLIALLVVVVVTAVGVVGGNAYGKHEFEKSRKIHIPDGVLAKTEPGRPANYLLIGSDSRPTDETPQEAQAYGTSKDTGGARSDVMMVLHVEPATRTGMLVSFPRDLVVQIPGHSGHNLLNAAYAFGGPSLVIQTIEQNFAPLKINHYIEVDFRGFKSIVNAIGKVHIWFPTPANDEFTGLHQAKAGCASLNGDQALAYARSRHYNIPSDRQNPAPWLPTGAEKTSVGWIEDPRSDLDRIPRQQYFLRTVSQAAIDKTGSDPTKIMGLLNAVFKNFARDEHLSYNELRRLAVTFRGLNPAKVDMMTLPVTQSPYPGFRAQVIAKYPDANPVIARLANFPTPTVSIPRPLSANQVSVRVVNGSGTAGAAARALGDLTGAGFRSAGPAEDADRSDYDKTQIRYAPGKFFEGFTTAFALGTQNLVEAASAKNTLGGDVLVIVGRDYDQLPHAFNALPGKKKTSSSSSKSSSASKGATPGSTPGSTAAKTTTTTLPKQTVDPRFVPTDPKTGGPLVGCPTK